MKYSSLLIKFIIPMLCLINYGISFPFGYGISPASLTSKIVFHFLCSILSVCLLGVSRSDGSLGISRIILSSEDEKMRLATRLIRWLVLISSGKTKYVPQYVIDNMENYGATMFQGRAFFFLR